MADPPVCNICGCATLITRPTAGGALCAECRSDGRTRLMWLMMADRGLLRPGLRVLHIAPERALAPRLAALHGEGYEPVDLQPEDYDHVPGIRRFDLVGDAAALPSRRYDLILHSHVMEHVPGNVSAILFHLHRALADDGTHLCCIPVMRNRSYAEDLGPIDPAEAEARFGQNDHVRRFGANDIQRTLGMIFALPETYDLVSRFGSDLLTRHAIPEIAWRGWSAQSVLALAKRDLLLRG